MSMRPTPEDQRGDYVASVAVAAAQRDAAYRERDALVAALSKVFPAHLSWHLDRPEEEPWEDGWRNIVCVHLPTGQVTWHVSEDEMPLFAHLGDQAPQDRMNHWDGHDTPEKYRRLNALPGREVVGDAAALAALDAWHGGQWDGKGGRRGGITDPERR